MSEMPATEHHPDPHAPVEYAHPTEGLYFRVAVFLFLMTALEVSTYYVNFGDAAIPLLLILMSIKFAVVAAFFMHLRFDSRLFRRVFLAGIVLAVGVYTIALATFEYWQA